MYYNFHFSSVTEENKLPNGSCNAGVCENPHAGLGVGAVAGTGKKPVCVKAAYYTQCIRNFIVFVAHLLSLLLMIMFCLVEYNLLKLHNNFWDMLYITLYIARPLSYSYGMTVICYIL